MVTRCNPQHFLNQSRSLQLLAFVLIVTWHFSAGIAADIHLRGEVGGNVTIHCPFAKQKTIILFYLQRGEVYINGYHTLHDISSIQTWENTRADRGKTTVHIYNLTASHSGDYDCIIQYSGIHEIAKSVIHLDVTANYSTPKVEVWCRDGLSCLVKCASHSGYPGTRMMWNVPGSEAWQVVDTSEIHDPDTMLVNSTSTASFNCSKGEERFLSCSVGNVTSDMFSVCTPNDSSDHYNPYVIVAAICVVVAVFVTVVLLLRRYKTRQTNTGAGNVDQTWRANGSRGEEEALNKTEAPRETKILDCTVCFEDVHPI